ncbi:MAG: DUF3786 domain-containing protein [Chloroflexi bacterium]|nr:DUF3786 domain-containing protein [Chloroflexota bacterium]
MPQKEIDALANRVGELREELRGRDTAVLVQNTAATFRAGEFHLPLWGQDVIITWPDFVGRDAKSGKPLPTFLMAMLAYYFHLADGAPLAGEWIAFTELPDGQFYTTAFQGYTGHKLAGAFGNDLAAFIRAGERSGGRRESLGDAAFAFRALPRVELLVVCWLGDEDFPPSYRVLFDTAVSHHLSTDACAILGSTITRRLLAHV